MSTNSSEISSSPLERAITMTSDKLISSFSIWGLPTNFQPEEFSFIKKVQTYPAQQLFCYPSKSELLQHFSHFIAPQGVDVYQTRNISCIFEPPKKYLLILPGETTTSFCVCIIRKEILQFASDFIEESKMQRIFSMGKDVTITERIYCFVSEYPHINALFTILEDMEKYDFFSKNNYIRVFYLRQGGRPNEKYLTDKKRMIEYLDCALALNSPDLSSYSFSFTVSIAPQRIVQRSCLYDTLKGIDKQPSCCLQMIADYTLPRLFVAIPIPTILQALASLLTGNSVILVGSNISLVTSAIFGLLTLLYPFIWQGVLIPFVPIELQEFLESPVPSLFGTEMPKSVTRVFADVIKIEDSSLFTPPLERRFIKTNQITKHILPFMSELSAALTLCLHATFPDITKHKTYDQRERALEALPPQKLITFSSEIQQKFKHHLYDKLIGFIRNYCVSKGPIDLDKFQVGFPQIVKHESHKKFMRDFIGSQHFNVWWYRNKMYELRKVQPVPSPLPISLGDSNVPIDNNVSPCKTPGELVNDIEPDTENVENTNTINNEEENENKIDEEEVNQNEEIKNEEEEEEENKKNEEDDENYDPLK